MNTPTGTHAVPTETLSVPQRGAGYQLRRVPAWVYLAVGALAVAALIPLSLLLTDHAATAQQNADAAQTQITAVKAQAAPLAGQVQSVCDSGGAAATQLNAAGACTQAARVSSVVAIPGPQGPVGPGPSQDEINAAVSAYLALHPPAPGQNASADQVAAAVAAYLSLNPPASGRPPTPSEIATAVTNYCAANGGCASPAGANASSDQIATAVSNYCAAHGGCEGSVGPAGPSGVAGPSGLTGPPPARYTIQVPGMLGGSTTETCTRDAGSPDSAPTYTCA